MLPVRVIYRFIVPRMLTSYEIRWFNSGKIPENIQYWFKQNCLSTSTKLAEKREDVYLYTPKCDYLGIKLRQGGLEIKWRYPEISAINFGSLVEGNIEKWKKWRCLDSTEESFSLEQISENPVWVKVRKVRYLQRYQIQDKLPQAVSSDVNINNCCSLELTNIEINCNEYWSLALETSGEDCDFKDNLHVMADFLLKRYSFMPLKAQDSYGYPRLLELII